MVIVKKTKQTSDKFHKDNDNPLSKRTRITHEKENIDISCSVILNQIKRESVSNTRERDIIFLKEVKNLSNKDNRFNRRNSSSKFPYNLRHSLPYVKSDYQDTSKICINEEKRTKFVSPETVKQSIMPCFVVLNQIEKDKCAQYVSNKMSDDDVIFLENVEKLPSSNKLCRRRNCRNKLKRVRNRSNSAILKQSDFSCKKRKIDINSNKDCNKCSKDDEFFKLSKNMKSCSVILDKLNVEKIRNKKVLTSDDISYKSSAELKEKDQHRYVKKNNLSDIEEGNNNLKSKPNINCMDHSHTVSISKDKIDLAKLNHFHCNDFIPLTKKCNDFIKPCSVKLEVMNFKNVNTKSCSAKLEVMDFKNVNTKPCSVKLEVMDFKNVNAYKHLNGKSRHFTECTFRGKMCNINVAIKEENESLIKTVKSVSGCQEISQDGNIKNWHEKPCSVLLTKINLKLFKREHKFDVNDSRDYDEISDIQNKDNCDRKNCNKEDILKEKIAERVTLTDPVPNKSVIDDSLESKCFLRVQIKNPNVIDLDIKQQTIQCKSEFIDSDDIKINSSSENSSIVSHDLVAPSLAGDFLKTDIISCANSTINIPTNSVLSSEDVATMKAKNDQIMQKNKETVTGLACDSIKDIVLPTYICAHCNKTLPSVKALYYHTCNKKTKRGFLCDICHKNFDFYRLLVKHRLTHNAEASLSCSETIKCRRVLRNCEKEDFPPTIPKKKSGGKINQIWDQNNFLLKSQKENISPKKVLIKSILIENPSRATTSTCRYSRIWVPSNHKIFN